MSFFSSLLLIEMSVRVAQRLRGHRNQPFKQTVHLQHEQDSASHRQPAYQQNRDDGCVREREQTEARESDREAEQKDYQTAAAQCNFMLKKRNAVAFSLGSSLEKLATISFRGFAGIGLQQARLALSRSVSARRASSQLI
jgi:hypothetical protein